MLPSFRPLLAPRSSSGYRYFSEITNKPVRRNTKLGENRPIIQAQRKRNAEHEARAAEMGLGWRIVGSTVLHRYPVITPDPEPWEVEYVKMKEKIEGKKREWLMDQIRGTTAELICEKSLSHQDIVKTLPFTPAPRTTQADIANDRSTHDRRLQDSLYLIVKRNRADNPWQFPQGKLQPNETLRAAAERVISRAAGPVQSWFISNAPMGHYCYAYPPEVQQQRKQYGSKVFFYRCQYLKGNVRLENRLYKDQAWIARSEVGDYFEPDLAAYLSELLPY